MIADRTHTKYTFDDDTINVFTPNGNLPISLKDIWRTLENIPASGKFSKVLQCMNPFREVMPIDSYNEVAAEFGSALLKYDFMVACRGYMIYGTMLVMWHDQRFNPYHAEPYRLTEVLKVTPLN